MNPAILFVIMIVVLLVLVVVSIDTTNKVAIYNKYLEDCRCKELIEFINNRTIYMPHIFDFNVTNST